RTVQPFRRKPPSPPPNLRTYHLHPLNQPGCLLDRVDSRPASPRVSTLALDSDDKLRITNASNMEHFYPAISGNTIVDILRNHMLIHKKVDAGVPAHLFVCCKSRSNRPSELCTSFHQRLQRKDRARVRPFHIRR